MKKEERKNRSKTLSPPTCMSGGLIENLRQCLWCCYHKIIATEFTSWCRTASSGSRTKTKSASVVTLPAGCYYLHCPLLFTIIHPFRTENRVDLDTK